MAPARPVVIRRLGPSNAVAYRAVRLRSLHDHPDAFTSGFEEESEKPLAHAQARLGPPSHERIWGAFESDDLIGMVGLTHEARIKNRHKATLFGMFVAAEHAGRGIGRQLIEALMADARNSGLTLIVLTVTEGNQHATALYQKAGFEAFGTEPDAMRINGVSFSKTHMYCRIDSEPRQIQGAFYKVLTETDLKQI